MNHKDTLLESTKLHHAYKRDGTFVGSYPDDERIAAISGFAQSIHDYNTKGYIPKYQRLLRRQQDKIWCGNVYVSLGNTNQGGIR